jgi:hypothetical protein
LQQAEGDHLADILRQPTQDGGDRKAGGADDEQLLAPNRSATQPIGAVMMAAATM